MQNKLWPQRVRKVLLAFGSCLLALDVCHLLPCDSRQEVAGSQQHIALGVEHWEATYESQAASSKSHTCPAKLITMLKIHIPAHDLDQRRVDAVTVTVISHDP